MQAIILAAGMGKRLGELTKNNTKCMVEVNGSIIGGFTIKHFMKSIMKEHLVHLVGTDAHDPNHRSPLMRKAAIYVERKHGHAYMEQIFWRNGVAVLRNEKI